MTTAANQLYQPLGRKPEAEPRQLGLRLVPSLLFVGTIVGGLTLWVAVVDDPLGGEPRATVAMPALPAAAVQPPAPALQPAVPQPAPDQRTQVSIITPGGPNGQLQVRTVDVPDGRPRPALQPAPNDRFADKTRFGILPRIAQDGTRPWRFYARTVEAPPAGRPRIAILVGGLGLSVSGTNEAIQRLPPDVTFAFAPYGSNLQAQVNRARGDGHEVMLQVPLEPFDFPANDPGPQTLLTTLTPEQNLERLNWAMSRFAGYTGIVNFMGAKFSANQVPLRAFLQELRNRGLVYADDGSSPRSLAANVAREVGIGFARGQVQIDANPTPERIDAALVELEEAATRSGAALGIASALPVTIERLARWARDLERRGFALVPVSQVVAGDRP